MTNHELLAEEFERHRDHLTAVAYRMLGSLAEADDAVQEAWLRLSRSDSSEVDNIGGWLTTVVARLCLDMLRTRKSRREEPIEVQPESHAANDPEKEAVLADSVGLALLVVLDTLAPAERLAFVLHDMFGVDFDEIARVVGKTPAAARQLASRARRRVQGADVRDARVSSQREIVDAFLAALRARDFEGLLAVLDPDVVVRAEAREIRGAETWARGAVNYGHMARAAQVALINGTPGLVVAPNGRLVRALQFSFANGKISEKAAIAPAFMNEKVRGICRIQGDAEKMRATWICESDFRRANRFIRANRERKHQPESDDRI